MAEIKNKFNSSFGILRANPKISGNVKITVDSSKNLWLNSIDSNDQLAKSTYKGFKISSNSDYAQDLYKFFDKGKTDEQFVFDVKNGDSPVTTYVSNYEDQYNGMYSAGVTPLISDIYTEEFSYFAPFWLGRKIPNHFVIYRIDDPIDFSYINPVTSLIVGKSYKVVGDSTDYTISSATVSYTNGSIFIAANTSFTIVSGTGNVLSLDPNYNYNLIGDPINHFEKKILPKTSIVATYDMSANSEIGKYLRKIQASSNYKESLIDSRFEENIMTYYNGVNYNSGVYDTKGEYLFDFYINPTTQIEFEDFITGGFSRNGIISYKYLNLEFLFNDDEAPIYSINRYFGVFVDEVPSGTFRLNGTKFFTNDYLVGNSPEPKAPNYISSTLETSFYQENDKGVRLFIDPDTTWGIIPTSDTVNSNPRFYYIKDNKGNFYSYKRILDYSTASDPSYQWGNNTTNQNEVVLSNKLVDLSNFTGFDATKVKQISGTVAGQKGHPYAIIDIGGPFNSGEAIIIYHPLGGNVIAGKKCDIIMASDMSTLVEDWGPGSFYNVGGAIYFHPFGTNEEIASAIFGAINSLEYRGFEGYLFGTEIVLRCYGTGYNYNFSFSVDCFTDLSSLIRMNRLNVFSLNGIDALDFRSEQFFIGGTDHVKNRIMIKIEDSNKIIPGTSVIRTTDGISIIDNIFAYVDDVQNTSRNDTLAHYKTHAIITYEDYIKTANIGYLGMIIVEEIFQNGSGVFSMYPIKDMDFDWWYSEYNIAPTEEYYRYLDLQPGGISKIMPGQTYCVNGGCLILYDGVYYGDTGTSPTVYTFTGTSVETFEIITKSPDARFVVIPLAFTKNPLTGAINGSPEPLTDLDNFPGFPGIQDIKFIDDINTIVTKKDQMNFGKLDTEYEVLKENYLKEFVTKSRVTPYINKWVYEGGLDARGNEYRLNIHPAFTPFNFSPSFFSVGRDPRFFTHEWYLIETPRLDSPDTLVQSSLNYCADILDLNKLTNSDPSNEDYFLKYFTIDGTDFYTNLGNFESSGPNPQSEKYTVFEYNTTTGYSETLFRGIKVKIKKRTDAAIQTGTRGVFKVNDNGYDGYKFSCLIRPVEDSNPYTPTPPVTYKIYENDTFKTVTLVISIINSDSRFVDGIKYWDIVGFSPAATGGSWEFNPTGIYGGLDYMSLYSLDDKLILKPAPTDYISIISDIKLSASLNFSFDNGPLGIPPIFNGATINGTGVIPIIRNAAYNTDLRDEINNFYLPSTPVFGPGSPYDLTASPPLTINGTNEDGVFSFYSPEPSSTDNWFTLPWPVGAGKNQIYFNQVDPVPVTGSYMPNFTNVGYPPPIFALAPVNVDYTGISIKAVYQKEGGNSYWSKLLEKISFADIALLLNNEDIYVKYYAYNWDATTETSIESLETFALEVSQPSAFIQKTNLYPLEDLNKPQSLAKVIVGYNMVMSNSDNEYYRYGGGYNPKFKDVIPFSSFKNDRLEDEELIIPVKLVEKTTASLFNNIGSEYEIEMDSSIRKRLRLVRGLTYTFNYENFFSPGFGPSPTMEIMTDLVISNVQNDGTTSSLFTKGVSYDTTFGISMTFTVPYDAPDTLYYELKGERFAGGGIMVEENLGYKNAKLGLDKKNFGLLKNISYNKYALINPFTIDPNSGYKPVYPLIDEAPFDLRDMSIFESTWDPGRYRNYLGKSTYELVPGTRSMLEEKNFFGSKVMKTPANITIQKQLLYSTQIPKVFDLSIELYPSYEIFWEETDTQIMAVLLLDRSLINYFDANGVGATFNRLLLPDFGTGDKSTLADDINNYLELNVVPTFKSNNINVYVKKIKKDSSTITMVTDLNDHDKIRNGFYILDQVNVIETEHLQYEFTLTKDPSFDYQISFSYNLTKI